jgi:hypothetical protein
MKLIIKNDGDRQTLITKLMQIKLDKPYEVTVKLHRRCRSLAQNKLLHMWLKCISDETGNSTETLYVYFCQRYLPWNTELCFGKEIQKQIGGSSKLNTKEFTEFLDNINQEMAEQGIMLPQPREIGWDEFYSRYTE